MSNKMERFTSRARRVLALAQQEAETAKTRVIAVEHLLIALALEDEGVAGKVLDELGATVDVLRAAQPPIVTTTAPTQQLELADEVKRVLELSVDEARKLGHHTIGTEHLVLGILRLNHVGVNKMLAACELDANDLRRATLSALQTHPLNTKPKRKYEPGAPIDMEATLDEIYERLAGFIQSLFSGKRKR
jgi:ATP-dependent Clp protease ATP-binding subunit ClpC